MTKKTKLGTAAVLTINDAPNMSARGRRDVAKWLRSRADFLLSDSQSLARRWTARYFYKI